MEKLNELIKLCKASVSIEINEHKDSREEVYAWVKRRELNVNEDFLEIMEEKDTFVYLEFYPNTPIDSYVIIHYDVEIAIDIALNLIKKGQTK